MSGIELLERFREESPGTTRILLTGYVDLESSVDAINRGSVYRLVRKPWDDSILRNAILAGAAESIAARASGALRRLLGELIGSPTKEAAFDALARFLDKDSGLGLSPPIPGGLVEGTEPAGGTEPVGERAGRGEGGLKFALPASPPGGAALSIAVPGVELEFFEAAGLARSLADMIESALDGLGIALEAIEARSRLLELSEHDPLSGLLNRRAMSARISAECVRLERYGHPFAVLLIDVDKFKLINDRYGHAKGDEVLAGIGRTILGCCRSPDIAARIGGDEFLLGLPETDAAGAAILARRLGAATAELGKDLELEDRLTLSIGMAVAPAGSCGIEAIIEAADASMYEVKRKGRDGVGEARES
jgi:diguanylate cyclase (GGDEF)-like protein